MLILLLYRNFFIQSCWVIYFFSQSSIIFSFFFISFSFLTIGLYAIDNWALNEFIISFYCINTFFIFFIKSISKHHSIFRGFILITTLKQLRIDRIYSTFNKWYASNEYQRYGYCLIVDKIRVCLDRFRIWIKIWSA